MKERVNCKMKSKLKRGILSSYVYSEEVFFCGLSDLEMITVYQEFFIGSTPRCFSFRYSHSFPDQ